MMLLIPIDGKEKGHRDGSLERASPSIQFSLYGRHCSPLSLLLIFLIILVNIYLVTSTIILLYIKFTIIVVILVHINIHILLSTL
jgi:hypothetical protein